MTDRDPILTTARTLREDVAPPRDLWPEIRQRIAEPPLAVVPDSRPARTVADSPWRRLTGAVALAAAVVTMMMLVQPGLESVAPTVTAGPTPLTRLDQDYADARNDLDALLAERCAEWPATACAPLRESAETLERSAATLRQALASVPADSPGHPVLLARFADTVQRTRDLTSRMATL